MYPGENVTWRKRTFEISGTYSCADPEFFSRWEGGGGEWGRSLGDGSGGQDSRTDKIGCVFRKKKRIKLFS